MAFSFTANNPQQFNNDSAFTSGTLTSFNGALTAGSIIYTIFALPVAATSVAVSDTAHANLTWTVLEGDSDGTYTLWAAYAENPSYASTEYIQITYSGVATGIFLIFGELLGGPASSPLSTSNQATGSSSAATLSLSGLSSGSAIVSLTTNLNNVTPGVGSGYTGSGSGNGVIGYGEEYNLSSASGTVTVNFTGSAGTWNQMALAFGTSVPSSAPIAWIS